MGKVKITVNPEQEAQVKQEEVKAPPAREVIVEKHIVEVQKCQGCQCKPQKLDKRLRRYARAVRKQLHSKVESKSLDLVNVRLDLQSERIKDLAQGLDKVYSDLEGSKHELEIARLQKQANKMEHHIELLEQEMKVKPVSIKKEVVVERFDHRLTLMTILMLFINAFLVMHILTN